MRVKKMARGAAGQKALAMIVGAACLAAGIAAGVWLELSRQQPKPAAAAETTVRFVNVWAGDAMPPFELPALEEGGAPFRYPEDRDPAKVLVLNVHSPDCPCAANCAELINEMATAGYGDAQIIGILSGADRIETLVERVREQIDQKVVSFPVYRDPGLKVKELLGAKRTPTIWVVDKAGRVAFVGAPESTLFPGAPGHRYLLREAVDAVRSGKPMEPPYFEPLGCPIEVDESGA